MSIRIGELLRPRFARHAGLTAVVDREFTLTYRELDERSRGIAGVLASGGVQPGDRVCLALPKSAGAVAVILAVLDAGAVYVPLDCESPPARLASMVRSCAPCWIVLDPDRRELVRATLDAAGNPPVHGTFALDPRLSLVSDDVVRRDPRPGRQLFDAEGGADLAYILFTSGSSGQPKGVPIPHGHVVEYVGWANRQFGVMPDDRISAHGPMHFDMSVWDIFGTLAAGATLVLVPAEASLLPTLTAEFIRRMELTQWYSVPSILVAMARRDVLTPGDFPSLRRVIWGGEAFPVDPLRYWMTRVPHAAFTNVYGPTEATVNCTFHTLPDMPEASLTSVPIGVPIPGRRLAILDDAGRPVPPGQIGHLSVGGQGLSPGYWRDGARTSASFVETPAGSGERWYRTGDLAAVDDRGVYHFHGRSDRQIKSRGYRIELDDVAAALSRLPEIEESAVVAIPVEGFEGTLICAGYVPAAGRNGSVAEVKRALARELPAYMLPRRWASFERLPRNVNGKIDLARIKEIFADE